MWGDVDFSQNSNDKDNNFQASDNEDDWAQFESAPVLNDSKTGGQSPIEEKQKLNENNFEKEFPD